MTANLVEDKYQIYRVVTDYEGLHEGLIDRVEDLNVSRAEIDAAGGFAPGYAGKALCSPPIKILSRDRQGRDGLGKMLKATGLALIMVVDDERFAPVKAKIAQRKYKLRMHAMARSGRPPWLFTRDAAREMAKKRWDATPPAKRKRLARKAAKARWKQRKGHGALSPAAPSAPCADDQPSTITKADRSPPLGDQTAL